MCKCHSSVFFEKVIQNDDIIIKTAMSSGVSFAKVSELIFNKGISLSVIG